MPFCHTNLVTGLPFDWSAEEAGPLTERLVAALRTALRTGRLAVGDELPPTRVVAVELGISRWVVTQAYERLTAEGWFDARAGSGTTVARTATRREPFIAAPGTTAAAPDWDLTPTLPDLSSFPRAAWRSAYGRALNTLENHAFGYPASGGDAFLREQLAGYLRRARGIEAQPDDVVITRGTTQGLALLCRVLRQLGHADILMEDPGWPRAALVAQNAGLGRVAVPVDEHGLRVDLASTTTATVAFVAATHQYPTGVPLSPARRTDLLRWAREGNKLIIEDDYDAEFRYDRKPVGALAALDPTQVAYLGSTSKTLAPTLRLGWLVVQGSLRRHVQALLEAEASTPAGLEQRTLATLLADGAYERHLRKMRRVYQRRRTAMVAALRSALPDVQISGLDAGLHILVLLPGNVDEKALQAQALRLGASVTGLSTCRLSAPGPPGLVIGYGNVKEAQAPLIAELLAVALGRRVAV
ncbi:PLP-dependent aminotransferase family protein [Kribbella sp. NPDC003505]|uniref:MocR-like pyridoxine biosynthesis transcription factor PdxR n=1 Tax=Kribbella sp. NPDC003505 TaxID=3154448 RepID=UPI0033A0748A